MLAFRFKILQVQYYCMSKQRKEQTEKSDFRASGVSGNLEEDAENVPCEMNANESIKITFQNPFQENNTA